MRISSKDFLKRGEALRAGRGAPDFRPQLKPEQARHRLRIDEVLKYVGRSGKEDNRSLDATQRLLWSRISKFNADYRVNGTSPKAGMARRYSTTIQAAIQQAVIECGGALRSRVQGQKAPPYHRGGASAEYRELL